MACTARTLGQLVLVLEVPVEGAVGHAGGGRRRRRPGCGGSPGARRRRAPASSRASRVRCPAAVRSAGPPSVREHVAHDRAELEHRRSPAGRRVHVDVGLQAEQRAVDDVGRGRRRRGRPGTRRAPPSAGSPATSWVRVRHSSSSWITGSSWRGGSVVRRQPGAGCAPTLRSPVRTEPAGDRLVALRRGLERLEDRLVALVDVAVAGDPSRGWSSSPSASGVTGPRASVDALTWRATWPARCRKTSSLLEKYW